jgi:hypothetical protein
MARTSKYPFAEVRKTWAAGAGLLATIIGYTLADQNLSSHLPPKLVLVLGGVGTILAVFKTPNAQAAPTASDAVDAVQRAQAAVQAAQDHAAAASQGLQDIINTVGAGKSLAQDIIDSVSR